MIVIYKCGDIVQNAFCGVKPSSGLTMKIESQWYWGHCILIDKQPIEKWEQGQEFKFSGTFVGTEFEISPGVEHGFYTGDAVHYSASLVDQTYIDDSGNSKTRKVRGPS